jgi:hypothetical protein
MTYKEQSHEPSPVIDSVFINVGRILIEGIERTQTADELELLRGLTNALSHLRHDYDPHESRLRGDFSIDIGEAFGLKLDELKGGDSSGWVPYHIENFKKDMDLFEKRVKESDSENTKEQD